MEINELIEMTRALVEALYNKGRVEEIVDFADGKSISFGSRSLHFYTGPEGMQRCLQQELNPIIPCKLIKDSYKYQEEDGQTNVLVTAVVRSDNDPQPIIHRLIFMYRRNEGSHREIVRLAGLNIRRDYRHEETYRMVSGRMFGKQLTAKGEEKEISGTVTSYSDCAYVSYHYNDEGRIIDTVTPELWIMLDYPGEEDFLEKTGGNLDTLMPEEERPRIKELIFQQLDSRKLCQTEYRMAKANGGYIWVLECGRQGSKKSNGQTVFHCIILNITPLKNAGRTLRRQLSHDDLTGIYNKSAFAQRTHEIMLRRPDTEFELMRFDIKRFKVINELFGEDVGDSIICYLADFLKHIDIEGCAYGRLHSDQFVVSYPADNMTRERLIATLNTMALSYSIDYRIELAFGIYRIADRNMSITAMIDRAGIALSKAKNEAMISWSEYDDEMRRLIVNEQGIVNDMVKALKNGEFVVYMQPKYSLADSSITGAEALVRWIHPVRGLVSPVEFIPVFEHNGFIFELDKYIWEETCRQLRRWMDAGYPALPISINVSRVDFYREDLCDTLDALVKKYDIPPELLGLEVTESAYTDNPQQIIKTTNRLRTMGFRILMDDFGSGYSSLNMLKDMQVDVLKIDLKFLDNKEENDRGGNILNSVVRMAKWLRMQVVAEGVETSKQVKFLRAIGCDQAQGYFYSRPITVFEYEKLLMSAAKPHPVDLRGLNWINSEEAERLLSWDSHALTLLNAVDGCIGLYEYANGKLELVRATEGYVSVFGEKPEGNVNGGDAIDAVFPDDRGKLLQSIRQAKAENVVTEFTFRRTHADGRLLYIHAKARVVASEDERDLIYLSMTDVTSDQKHMTELYNLLKRVPGGISYYRIIDNNLRVIFVSSWLCKINGMKEDDSWAESWQLNDVVDPQIEAVMVEAFKESSRTGKAIAVEYPFTAADGRQYWLGMSLNALRRENGEYDGFGVVYDLTGQRIVCEPKEN